MKTPETGKDTNALRKTSEEIKNALDLCSTSGCPDCAKCAYDGDECCLEEKSKDALAYIQQLESRLAQVERERDAAVHDIEPNCDYCEFTDNTYGEDPCPTQEELEIYGLCRGFKWRGPCPENTKEDNDHAD